MSRSSAWIALCGGLLMAVPHTAALAMPPSPGSDPQMTAGDGTWTENLPGPRERSKHAAVYDSLHARMIMFGGRCQDACCPNGPVGSDVWILKLDSDTPRWVQIFPSGISPAAGLGPAAIYDPVRRRMLVPAAAGHVWELSLASVPQWNELPLTGAGPSPTAATAVYDPVRDRMIVVTSAGIWTLPLAGGTQWTQLIATGQAPIGVVTALYDRLRDRVVVFGDSVRVLSLSGPPTWTALTNNQMPRSHTAIYDPVRDRVVLHGGCLGADCGFAETWELSLSGSPVWTPLSTSGPLISYHSAVYDPSHGRMVVFGGYAKQFYDDWSSRELWTLSLDASLHWEDHTPQNPPRACDIPAVRDPARSRVVVFDDSVRTMSLAGLPSWNTLATAGPAPTPRQGSSTIVDPQRDRMMLFGGWVWSGNVKQPLTDLWALSLATPEQWVHLFPAGTPPASSWPAVHDPIRNRMLVIGPQRVWALRLADPMTWSEIVPSGTAPAVDSGFACAYDVAHDRVLVFGGGGSGGLVSDTWELLLAPTPAWNHLVPSGTPPAPRTDAIVVHDPSRNRMVISGGTLSGGATATDTWALTLATDPAWLPLATDGAAHGGSNGLYDPSHDRLVTLGTCVTASIPTCPDPQPGLWELWFGAVQLDVPEAPAVGHLSLAQSRPNPMRGSATIAFSIGLPGKVSLRVYDLSGRLVRTLVDGALARGDHVVRWDGRQGDGNLARPGAYFCELRAAGERLGRRLVLLQ